MFPNMVREGVGMVGKPVEDRWQEIPSIHEPSQEVLVEIFAICREREQKGRGLLKNE